MLNDSFGQKSMCFIADGIYGDLYSFRTQRLGFAVLNIKFDVLISLLSL